MKLKPLIFAALLTIIFGFTNTENAWASELNGYLDRIEGSALTGWAWDARNPEAAVTVTVTVTRVRTGQTVSVQTVSAGDYRTDLDASAYGTKNHGFTADIDWDSLENGVYRVSASACGSPLPNTLTYNKGDVEEAPGTPLGVFKTTAYCPCRSCSEGWGRRTSSGALATSAHTVAVDSRVIPIGSRLMIDGTVYTAEDVGGGVRGNHIDIYFNTHGETKQYGTRYSEVYLVG